MDFADVFNSLSKHMFGMDWLIKGLVPHPDLSEFEKQETEIKIFPVEYVRQYGSDEYGFYGEIYFPTTYQNSDGGFLYLYITYTD